MRGWKLFWGRWMFAVAVGVVVYLLLTLTPLTWESALLAGWDAALLTWLALVYFTIRTLDAKGVWEHAQSVEPATSYVLIIIILTGAIGLIGAVALPARNLEHTALARNIHLGASVLAVALAWLFIHIEFALYYARLYYDEKDEYGASDPDGPLTLVEFKKGLTGFPEGELVDYQGFLYYSFSIALSYQGPGIVATTARMRHTTILHAICSFVFTLLILGYTVTAIAQIL